MAYLRMLCIACSLAAASGCATLASTRSDVSSHEAPSMSPWWQRFNDPMLSGLIEEAMRQNTSVLGAVAALRQARALSMVVASALWPTLTGTASAQRNHSGRPLIAGAETSTNNFQVGVDAAWELDLFGTNRSGLLAAQEEVLASAATLADVRVSIAAEVALDYIALRTLQARIQIARDSISSQLNTLEITEWRLQAGLVTALDTAQSRTSAEQTSALMPALESAHAQQAHALSVLTGQAPTALLSMLSAPRALPCMSDESTASLPADTLRQRADVRAAEHQVSAAAARIDQAVAARMPSFTLGGSLGLSAAALGVLTHGTSVINTLVGSVSLPLWDGGERQAQVDVQQSLFEQAQQRHRSTVLLALQDVEGALVALRSDHVRVRHLALAAEAASGAAQMANQRYSSGLVDFQAVLETHRTQLGTQDNLASARADVASDQVRLYKATGGGWTTAPPPGGTR